LALFDKVIVEVLVVAGGAEFDDGMVGLVGLDDNTAVLVAAVGATDDLGEELESAFFGGEIGEGEAGVGLDDAEGGEEGQVEAFSDDLCADDDVYMAGFDLFVVEVEGVLVWGVGVEAGDFGIWEEFSEFGFDVFGAETFMEDVGVVAGWARGGDGALESTGMADEGVFVSVEILGEEAAGAKGLPAATVADGEGGGTATIVEDHGLGFGLQGVLNGSEELVGEEAMFSEVGTVFEINNLEMGGGLIFDGEPIEDDDGFLLVCQVIVGDSGSGGAHEGEGG